jgi:pimeloyl-ACP methyl ester carboxylesterase
MKQTLVLILLAGVMPFLNGLPPLSTTQQDFYVDKPIDNAGLVDIGGGRKIYLKCKGTGSPTVVLVSGRSDRSDIWQTLAETANLGLAVFPAVANFTKVCTYDRPGTITIAGNAIEPSRSTSIPQPTTPKKAVADLHALLTAAKIPGPFVLVGHSYGGLIVRLYASTYPGEVAGLVLIDTLTEFLYDALTQTQQVMWIRLNSNYSSDLDKYTIQERTDLATSFDQLRNSSILPSIPTIVLTSDKPYDFKSLIASGVLPSDAPIDFGTVVFQAHLTGQEHLTHMLHAEQVTNTHAGHYIQTEQPQLVIDSIREIVDMVRKGKNLNGAR